MKKKIALLLLSGCSFLGAANANTYDFAGNIANHNDVVSFSFTLLHDSTDFKIWTDSYQNGTNFDPMSFLWDASGKLWDPTGSLTAIMDDNPSINPAQTELDTGIAASTDIIGLPAGKYIFSVATFNNMNNGLLLSDGFNYDQQVPIPINTWPQPTEGIIANGYWAVHFQGVDAASVVPIPTTFWLLGSAFLGLIGLKRKTA